MLYKYGIQVYVHILETIPCIHCAHLVLETILLVGTCGAAISIFMILRNCSFVSISKHPRSNFGYAYYWVILSLTNEPTIFIIIHLMQR